MSTIWSYLPSVVAIGAILAAAAFVTAARPRVRASVAETRRFLAISMLTILAQATHFAEELSAGFFVEFPAVFGLPPFSRTAFIAFNLGWLLIWVVAVFGARNRLLIAVWALWFLGLASIVNMVAHPALALRESAYFPGLLTAPLVGVFGALLLGELTRLTSNEIPS